MPIIDLKIKSKKDGKIIYEQNFHRIFSISFNLFHFFIRKAWSLKEDVFLLYFAEANNLKKWSKFTFFFENRTEHNLKNRCYSLLALFLNANVKKLKKRKKEINSSLIFQAIEYHKKFIPNKAELEEEIEQISFKIKTSSELLKDGPKGEVNKGGLIEFEEITENNQAAVFQEIEEDPCPYQQSMMSRLLY